MALRNPSLLEGALMDLNTAVSHSVQSHWEDVLLCTEVDSMSTLDSDGEEGTLWNVFGESKPWQNPRPYQTNANVGVRHSSIGTQSSPWKAIKHAAVRLFLRIILDWESLQNYFAISLSMIQDIKSELSCPSDSVNIRLGIVLEWSEEEAVCIEHQRKLLKPQE